MSRANSVKKLWRPGGVTGTLSMTNLLLCHISMRFVVKLWDCESYLLFWCYCFVVDSTAKLCAHSHGAKDVRYSTVLVRIYNWSGIVLGKMSFFLFQPRSKDWMDGKLVKYLSQRIPTSSLGFMLPIEIPKYGGQILMNGNQKDGWLRYRVQFLKLIFLGFIPICEFNS